MADSCHILTEAGSNLAAESSSLLAIENCVAGDDPSDGVGGRKKRRLTLSKPYDDLIQAKRDKEAQDLEDLQAILEGRAPRILKPVEVKLTKAQQERAKKREAVPVVEDDDESDIEFLLLYG